MIRLTWLQFRLQTLVAGLGLAAVALAVALTHRHLSSVYDSVVAPCLAHPSASCDPTVSAFLGSDALLQRVLDAALLAAPALLGIFWGAPLVAREIEAHTYQLVWTQSVSRWRWLALKLLLVGLASAAVAGLLSLMVSWWFGLFDRVNANRFDPSLFDVRGIVPIGYALFAFALGVTVGLLLPRLVPAMALTLLLFIGGRFAMSTWVRPHLMTPIQQSAAFVWGPGAGIAQGGSSDSPAFVIPPTPDLPNAWVYANVIVDQTGAAPTSQFLHSSCPALLGDDDSNSTGNGSSTGAHGSGNSNVQSGPVAGAGPSQQQVQACVSAIAAKFHQVVTYQPASRYWTFQGLELALFSGLALALAGCSFWRVQRLA